MHRRRPLRTLALPLIALAFLVPAVTASGGPRTPRAYLPLVYKPVCPGTSSNAYGSALAIQWDRDDPVRPAWNHADKNLALRGYTPNTDGNLQRELVNYNGPTDGSAPQLATLFSPARVPPLVGFYRVYDWVWADSPDPGHRGDPLPTPNKPPFRVTALGLQTTPGQPLYVPTRGVQVYADKEALVIFADEDSVTLHYTREDSAALGYTIHVDKICTDPNLLAKYNSLDTGARYQFRSQQGYCCYSLAALRAGESIGVARGREVVVAIVDRGSFMDPRSCKDWWQNRPGYTGGCPIANEAMLLLRQQQR